MDIELTLCHYVTHHIPGQPLPKPEEYEDRMKNNPPRWWQTIIYGQIEGKDRSHPGQSDFAIVKLTTRDPCVYHGENLLVPGLKELIIQEALPKIDQFKKLVDEGKVVWNGKSYGGMDREVFTISDPCSGRSCDECEIGGCDHGREVV